MKTSKIFLMVALAILILSACSGSAETDTELV